jgi:uncharacterized protein YecE (DUF72 family)
MIKSYIGCSGFHYKEWKEYFYPEGLSQKNWFKFYCTQFNTLELNVTFYKFPTIQGLKKWHDESCPGFQFSVKAPRLITHYKKFNDCKRLTSDFYHAVDKGLSEKTGCILFQLPSSIIYSEQTLESISDLLNPEFENVIEFRHESWWRKSVFQYLKERKIIFCNISHPSLADKLYFTSETTYIRMHGVPKLYFSSYDEVKLTDLYNAVSQNKLNKAYIYFNNTATSAAIENARFLIDHIHKSSKMAYDFSPGDMPEIKKSKRRSSSSKVPKKKTAGKKVATKKAVKKKYPPVNDLG